MNRHSYSNGSLDACPHPALRADLSHRERKGVPLPPGEVGAKRRVRAPGLATLSLIAVLFLTSCASQEPSTSQKETKEASVSRAMFGKTTAGETVEEFTLINAQGMEMRA